MKSTRTLLTALAVALVTVLAQPTTLAAGEITVLCSNGIKAVMDDLVPKFEKATGHKVVIDYNLAAVLKQKIEGGTAFDLAILTPPLVDDLIKQGKMAADSRTMLARSGLGLLIRTGGHKRDISTTDAFKRRCWRRSRSHTPRSGQAGSILPSSSRSWVWPMRSNRSPGSPPRVRKSANQLRGVKWSLVCCR